MAGFNEEKSRRRVRRSIENLPAITSPESLRDDERIILREGRLRKSSFAEPGVAEAKVFEIEGSSVQGFSCVHAYIDWPKISEVLSVLGADTEVGHARAMNFFAALYAGADRLIDNTDAARVDFHNGRIHVVRARPLTEPCRAEDVAEVAGVCRAIGDLGVALIKEFTRRNDLAEFRAGVDTGICAAWDDGDRDGAEVVFVGSPANHAAKLASGIRPGIYLTKEAAALLAGSSVQKSVGLVRGIESYRFSDNIGSVREDILRRYDSYVTPVLFEKIMATARNAAQERSDRKDFIFSGIRLPLSDLKFSDLSPSQSKRSFLSVMVADIVGYTAFVDQCIASGDFVTPVQVLYVLRQELRDCLTDDFESKKVRFIGDCIQACLADGHGYTLNQRHTAIRTVLAASALHRAVRICCEELGSAIDLRISIGAELAETALTRSGIRGDRSVRIAAGSACLVSEECQADCPADELRVGPTLKRLLPSGMVDLHVGNGRYSISSRADVRKAIDKGIKRPSVLTGLSTQSAYTPRARAK